MNLHYLDMTGNVLINTFIDMCDLQCGMSSFYFETKKPMIHVSHKPLSVDVFSSFSHGIKNGYKQCFIHWRLLVVRNAMFGSVR